MDAIKVESHPFTYDDAPIEKIIHAVAWTKGCEPESLEPLYEVIDPDALAALLESNQGSPLTVTFSYEGCDVHVDRNGLITVREHPKSVAARLPRPVNVLLVEPRCEQSPQEFCTELLDTEQGDDATVLQVKYASADAKRRSSRSLNSTTAEPSQRIIMGEFTRSASTETTSLTGEDRVQQLTIPDPDDLGRLGCHIREWLSAQADAKKQPVVCFQSINDLLQHVELRQAFRFLYILTARIRAADGVAHFHLLADTIDDETQATLEPLFDCVIEVGQNEDVDQVS